MKQAIKPIVDYSTLVFIPDPASTDGSGKTGLVAANLTVSYTRVETDNDVVVTDVTSSLNNLALLTTAHTDWGLLEVSSTLAPGLYRLDLADAVLAAGAWSAVVYVMITTSAAAASPMEFIIVAYDPLDAVRLGLTALPNAAPDAAGGLPVSDAGGLDLDARLDIAVSTRLAPAGTLATVTTLINLPAIPANWLTTAGIADGALTAAKFAAGAFDAVWTVAARTLTSFGTLASDVWAVATRVLTAATNLTTALATPTNITGGVITTVTNLTNAPTAGDLTAAMIASVTTAATASTPALSAAGVDAIWDDAVDGSTTARQSLRLANSANGAKLSGAATTTVTIRDLADTKARVTATVDSSGNRTVVTTDLT